MKAYHVCVGGPSGGGKSTYLRELHAEYDGLSVFLTTKDDETTAVHDPPRRIVRSPASYPDDIAQVREWARDRPESVQVIVDEAQNAPSFRDKQGADGPVRKGLHEDRDQAVKWVIATQNPQDLRTSANNYGPVQQCVSFVWVGPTRTWHSGFLNWLSIDAGELPDDDHEVAVIEPSDPPHVVHRTKTKRKYA